MNRCALVFGGCLALATACGDDDGSATGSTGGAAGSTASGAAGTGSSGAAGTSATGAGGAGGDGLDDGGASATGTGGSAGAGGIATGTGGSASTDGGTCGGPVMASVPDTHCASPDGGRGDDVPPHAGTEADDDLCTFHVVLTVPCIHQNQDATFTLKLTNLGGATPVTGADPEIAGVIGNHPMPNTNPTSTETNGVYTIGPVRFDRMGRWTITFHVFDAMPAKLSHFSFYVDVP